jgi:anti-anti-sigma factor
MLYTHVKDLDEVRVITVLVDVIQFNNYVEVFGKVRGGISDFTNLIVLDLTMVKFMDSLSLGMLVPLLLYSRRLGGDLVVVAPTGKILDLFHALQLDRVLDVFTSIDAAVAFYRREEAPDGVDQ